MTAYGNIVGNNGSKVIKIAGLSKQGLSDNDLVNMSYHKQSQMVGNYADTNTSRYGSGGYVIFADYEGVCLTSNKNIIASGVNDDDNAISNASDNNVDSDCDPYRISGDKCEPHLNGRVKLLSSIVGSNNSISPSYMILSNLFVNDNALSTVSRIAITGLPLVDEVASAIILYLPFIASCLSISATVFTY